MEGVYLLSALDLGDGVLCRGFMVARRRGSIIRDRDRDQSLIIEAFMDVSLDEAEERARELMGWPAGEDVPTFEVQ